MERKSKIIILFVCLTLAIFALAGTAYAWFVQRRDSMVLIAGDIQIDVVSARYAFMEKNEDHKEEIVNNGEQVGFSDLDEMKLNTVPMAFGDAYVVYEFVIKNLSVTDVNLSLRFGDFSDYLFKGIKNYSGANSDLNIPFDNYTAKSILHFKYLKYSYNAATENIAEEDIVWVPGEVWDNSSLQTVNGKEGVAPIWKYSYGKYIIGNDGLFKPIKIDARKENNESANDCVTIRIAIDDGIDQEIIKEYYNWITQEDGYAEKRCEAILGAGDNEELIKSYLDAVKEGERHALSEASKIDQATGGGGGFQLVIDYFEFSGENIPYNDNEIKNNGNDPNI